MKNIKFTTRFTINEEFYPRPSDRNLPDWYVKMEAYGGYGRGKDAGYGKKVFHNGEPNSTIKKCVPVLDAMTAGYTLVTPVDVWVSREEGEEEPTFSSRQAFFKVSGHANGQAKNHPIAKSGRDIPKFMNPWMIETPAGYSVLIVPPMHNPNGIFTCLPGVVDTDTYTNEINFPFTLDDPSFSGLIPAGTPMVQVIPFKRDSWEMKIGGAEEIAKGDAVMHRLSAKIFNAYKTMFWSRKEFK